MPLPFTAQKRLVVRNSTRGQRVGSTEVTQEVVEPDPGGWLRFPGEEVVIAAREGELTPAFGRKLIDHRYVQALDEALARVRTVRIDGYQGAGLISSDTVCRAPRTIDRAGTVAESVRIGCVEPEKDLRGACRRQEQVGREQLIPVHRHGETRQP